VGISERKRPLVRHKRRWEDNIKNKYDGDGALWTSDSGYGQLVGSSHNSNGCYDSIKCGEFLD
jgi:hypothetical protein